MVFLIAATTGFLATQIPFGPWEIFRPAVRLPSPGERMAATVMYPDNLPAVRVRFHTPSMGFSLQGSSTPPLDRRDETGSRIGSVQYSFLHLSGTYFHRFALGEREVLAVLEPLVLYEGIGPDFAVAMGVSGGLRTPITPTLPLEGVLQVGPLGAEVYSRFSRTLTLPAEALTGLEWRRPTAEAFLLLRVAQQSGVSVGGLWWPRPQMGLGFSFRSWLRAFATGSGRDVLAGLSAHLRFRIRSYEVAYAWLSLGTVGDAHALGVRFSPSGP